MTTHYTRKYLHRRRHELNHVLIYNYTCLVYTWYNIWVRLRQSPVKELIVESTMLLRPNYRPSSPPPPSSCSFALELITVMLGARPRIESLVGWWLARRPRSDSNQFLNDSALDTDDCQDQSKPCSSLVGSVQRSLAPARVMRFVRLQCVQPVGEVSLSPCFYFAPSSLSCCETGRDARWFCMNYERELSVCLLIVCFRETPSQTACRLYSYTLFRCFRSECREGACSYR